MKACDCSALKSSTFTICVQPVSRCPLPEATLTNLRNKPLKGEVLSVIVTYAMKQIRQF